jgi:cell division protein YceG involved in septum cleavage
VRRLIAVLVVLALIGFGTSRALDWWNYNVNTPVSPTSQRVVFHIDTGELASQIGSDLNAQHLIRDRTAFDLTTPAPSSRQAHSSSTET